jgi:antitoxin component YwqK of YwqJK toxin-antitoxin module
MSTTIRLLLIFGLFASLAGRLPKAATAQEKAANTKEQILLDEPEPAPEPTIVQQAPSIDKYEDGKTRVERQVIQLSDNQIVNHGKFTEYYRNGQKFSEGVYENGVLVGDWSYWHENGQLAKKVTFKNGVPDGSWDTFREDGSLSAKKSYKDGLRQGTWTQYYDDGKTVKIEQSYVDGKIEGPIKMFHENGKPRQHANYKGGLLSGKMEEWNEDGEKVAEATFKAGKLDGKLTRWNTDGTTFEQTYVDGKLAPNAKP